MSHYLDDMIVKKGSKIICAGNISAPWFTLGKTYVVDAFKSITDDKGKLVKFPSARFNYSNNR